MLLIGAAIDFRRGRARMKI